MAGESTEAAGRAAAVDDASAEIEVQTTSVCKRAGIFCAARSDLSKPVSIDWGDGTA